MVESMPPAGGWRPNLPWEGPPIPRFLSGWTPNGPDAVGAPTAQSEGSDGKQPDRPGCTAADNSLLVQAHLKGLAGGRGGFGVLRTSKEKLEEGADAAERVGRGELAEEMRRIAGELPDVRTQSGALALSEALEPVVEQCWELGRRCKGALSPEELERARRLIGKPGR